MLLRQLRGDVWTNTMKSVGVAAMEMVKEVKFQFKRSRPARASCTVLLLLLPGLVGQSAASPTPAPTPSPTPWMLAFNLNPSDGHNFGWGATEWSSGNSVGSASESGGAADLALSDTGSGVTFGQLCRPRGREVSRHGGQMAKASALCCVKVAG